MLVTCKYCKEGFLTEADDYVVRPTDNYNVHCGCDFNKTKDLRDKVEQLKDAKDITKTYIRLYDRKLCEFNILKEFVEGIGNNHPEKLYQLKAQKVLSLLDNHGKL